MAWPMLQWVLNHHYADLRNETIIYSALIVNDAHESDLLSFMEEFQATHPDIKLSSLPRFLLDGGRQIELGVSGETIMVAEAFNALKQAIKDRGLAYQLLSPKE